MTAPLVDSPLASAEDDKSPEPAQAAIEDLETSPETPAPAKAIGEDEESPESNPPAAHDPDTTLEIPAPTEAIAEAANPVIEIVEVPPASASDEVIPTVVDVEGSGAADDIVEIIEEPKLDRKGKKRKKVDEVLPAEHTSDGGVPASTEDSTADNDDLVQDPSKVHVASAQGTTVETTAGEYVEDGSDAMDDEQTEVFEAEDGERTEVAKANDDASEQCFETIGEELTGEKASGEELCYENELTPENQVSNKDHPQRTENSPMSETANTTRADSVLEKPELDAVEGPDFPHVEPSVPADKHVSFAPQTPEPKPTHRKKRGGKGTKSKSKNKDHPPAKSSLHDVAPVVDDGVVVDVLPPPSPAPTSGDDDNGQSPIESGDSNAMDDFTAAAAAADLAQPSESGQSLDESTTPPAEDSSAKDDATPDKCEETQVNSPPEGSKSDKPNEGHPLSTEELESGIAIVQAKSGSAKLSKEKPKPASKEEKKRRKKSAKKQAKQPDLSATATGSKASSSQVPEVVESSERAPPPSPPPPAVETCGAVASDQDVAVVAESTTAGNSEALLSPEEVQGDGSNKTAEDTTVHSSTIVSPIEEDADPPTAADTVSDDNEKIAGGEQDAGAADPPTGTDDSRGDLGQDTKAEPNSVETPVPAAEEMAVSADSPAIEDELDVLNDSPNDEKEELEAVIVNETQDDKAEEPTDVGATGGEKGYILEVAPAQKEPPERVAVDALLDTATAEECLTANEGKAGDDGAPIQPYEKPDENVAETGPEDSEASEAEKDFDGSGASSPAVLESMPGDSAIDEEATATTSSDDTSAVVDAQGDSAASGQEDVQNTDGSGAEPCEASAAVALESLTEEVTSPRRPVGNSDEDEVVTQASKAEGEAEGSRPSGNDDTAEASQAPDAEVKPPVQPDEPDAPAADAFAGRLGDPEGDTATEEASEKATEPNDGSDGTTPAVTKTPEAPPCDLSTKADDEPPKPDSIKLSEKPTEPTEDNYDATSAVTGVLEAPRDDVSTNKDDELPKSDSAEASNEKDEVVAVADTEQSTQAEEAESPSSKKKDGAAEDSATGEMRPQTDSDITARETSPGAEADHTAEEKAVQPEDKLTDAYTEKPDSPVETMSQVAKPSSEGAVDETISDVPAEATEEIGDPISGTLPTGEAAAAHEASDDANECPAEVVEEVAVEVPPSPTLSKSSSHKQRADHWQRAPSKPTRRHTTADTKHEKTASRSSKRSSRHEPKASERPSRSRRLSMPLEDETERRRRREVKKAKEAARVAEEETERAHEEELRRIRHEARRAARKAAAEEAARLAKEEAVAVARKEAETRRRRREELEKDAVKAVRPPRERRESVTRAPLFFRTSSEPAVQTKEHRSRRTSKHDVARLPPRRSRSPEKETLQHDSSGPAGKEEGMAPEAVPASESHSTKTRRRRHERSGSDRRPGSRRDSERRSKRPVVNEQPRSFLGRLLRSFA